MPRIYLNSVDAELSEPINGCATVDNTSTVGRPAPFKYKLQCVPCQIKWRSEAPTDNCWSCGEPKRDPWFSLREKK